ncbi:dTDP-glucose 4,6-dehydratase [Halobellus rubicundus]|uniref:dTDP-glucose 4,6-dehydratase n=1 Tax=Halobellus rubicundus TaxID=2996466 RepID=A0ABD5MI12_9EURY
MPNRDSILITGGAGFIGSNLTRAAIERFEEVYVLDNLTYAGNIRNLHSVEDKITFIEGDIREHEIVSEIYEQVEVVVNLAAESHVDRSIKSGIPFLQSNVEGAYVLMELLQEHDVDRFIQMSTDEVYGSIEEGEFSEGDPLDPSSPYSASKASADLFVNACWETYDLPITIVRPTNIYGPRQHPEKLIPKFTLRALSGDRLPLYGDGSNVRQWLYVKDFCNALLQIVDHDTDGIYNVAGPERRSNIEVTKAILERVGASESLIEFVADRAGHDKRYAIDDSKLQEEIGFDPQYGFAAGLDETIEWYRKHRDSYQ